MLDSRALDDSGRRQRPSPTAALPDARLIEALMSSLPVAVAVVGPDLRYLRVNDAFAATLGTTASALCGRPSDDFEQPQAAGAAACYRQVLASGETLAEIELHGEPHPPFAATRCWLASFHPIAGADGRPVAVLQCLRDAGELRRAQSAVREGETRLRRLLDNLFPFVVVLAPDGTVLEANRPPLDAAGLTIDDVRGRKLWQCAWWDYDDAIAAQVMGAVERAAGGEVPRFDLVSCMCGDSRITLDFMIAPMHDSHGRVTDLIVSATDISDRKKGEEALRLSEERFRQVVESAPDGLAMVDASGHMVLVNARMEELFGYRRDELMGRGVDMLMPLRYRAVHDGQLRAYMRDPVARDMAGRRELYALRKDGSEFPVEIGLNPVPADGAPLALATIQDVTTRKAYCDLIEQALVEKTALLNEIHHRVKNNLQVISSLLSLQARNAGKEVSAALAESQGRVKAMALIHQLLYEHNDFASVDLGAYLQRLCHLLQESYRVERNRIRLHVDAGGAATRLDLQRAVPCGLLVNELVTNALRHAFPDGRGGEIAVALSALPDGRHRIVVADDGVGLPPHIELGRTRSLGLQLVPLLSEQAGGEWRLLRDHGTRFELILADDPKEKP